MEGNGHEVSEYPLTDFLPEIDRFIDDYVFNKKQLLIDINYRNKNRKIKKLIKFLFCDVNPPLSLVASSSKKCEIFLAYFSVIDSSFNSLFTSHGYWCSFLQAVSCFCTTYTLFAICDVIHNI